MSLNIVNMIRKGLGWSAGSKLLLIILQLLQYRILATYYTSTDFAIVAVVMFLFSLGTTTIDAGISNALIAHDSPSPNEQSSLFSFSVLLSIIIASIALTFSTEIASSFKLGQYSNVIFMYSFTFLLIPFGQQFQSLAQKNLMFDTIAKIELSASVLDILVSVVFAVLGHGIYSFVYGKFAYWTIRGLLFMGFGAKRWPITLRFKIREIQPFLKFGMYQFFSGYIFFFFTQLPKMLIPHFASVNALGLYEIANRIAVQPLLKITPVVRQVIFPVIVKMRTNGGNIQKVFLSYTSLTVIGVGMLTLAIIALPNFYIPLLLGNQWMQVIPIIYLISIGMFLRSTNETSSTLAFSFGNAAMEFKRTVFNLILTLPLQIIGGYFAGMPGILWAIIVTHLISLFYEYLFIIKKLLPTFSWKNYLSIPLALTTLFIIAIVTKTINQDLFYYLSLFMFTIYSITLLKPYLTKRKI